MESKEARELEPCPFCGSDAAPQQLRARLWMAGCTNEDCPVWPETRATSKAKAIELWNTRLSHRTSNGGREEDVERVARALADHSEPTSSSFRDLLTALMFKAGVSPKSGQIDTLFTDLARAALSSIPSRREVLEEAALAYGLLWHMQIDTRDDNLRLASEARKVLLATLSKDEQVDGITRAKATDGRFTGAA